MKTILNPYANLDGYCCFGCSPNNRLGLNMKFVEEGEQVVCQWTPRDEFQGFPNILHGGIQATLLDEIASWCIMIKLKTSGVTSRLDTRYIKPVKMNEVPITITAKIDSRKLNQVVVETTLTNSKGLVCTTAMVTYAVFPEEVAKKKLFFPDYKLFFEPSNTNDSST